MYLLPAHMAILHSLKRPKEILWRLWQPSRKFLISSKNHLEAVISVSVAETEENIGIVYMALGDYENALLRYKKTREVKIRSYGTGHASVADLYSGDGVDIANNHNVFQPKSRRAQPQSRRRPAAVTAMPSRSHGDTQPQSRRRPADSRRRPAAVTATPSRSHGDICKFGSR